MNVHIKNVVLLRLQNSLFFTYSERDTLYYFLYLIKKMCFFILLINAFVLNSNFYSLSNVNLFKFVMEVCVQNATLQIIHMIIILKKFLIRL